MPEVLSSCNFFISFFSLSASSNTNVAVAGCATKKSGSTGLVQIEQVLDDTNQPNLEIFVQGESQQIISLGTDRGLLKNIALSCSKHRGTPNNIVLTFQDASIVAVSYANSKV